MNPKVIRSEKEHRAALKRIEALWNSAKGSPGAEELDVWSTLVDSYEREHHPIEAPDPVDAIRFRMEQMGWKPSDLACVLGGRNRVSEVLNRKRNLTVEMMRNLCRKLGVPAESLLEVPGRSAARETQAPYRHHPGKQG